MVDAPDFFLAGVTLEDGLARPSAEIEMECRIAIHDLLEGNYFRPLHSPGGPYQLLLSAAENRLALDVRLADGTGHGRYFLAMTAFRPVFRDYLAVCQSYYAAIHEAPPSRIEAIDMGRRGLHDDGSRLLMGRLAGKIDVDMPTARRLFTLISALHLRS